MAVLLSADPSVAGSVQELKFRVLLDGDPIGFHHYTIESRAAAGNDVEVRSKASFDVRILFFTAYRYRHNNVETWDGDCLRSLDADTNANGNKLSVDGVRRDDRFLVRRDEETATLPSCVSSFAYWDTDILQQNRLLNPQTGEYVDVSVEQLGRATLSVRGQPRDARQYRLVAGDRELRLWYSESDEWLALESDIRGGRTLRYELD
jgi:hypothetical protein